MEATGRDGRRGLWRYYRVQTGSSSYASSSISTSGTVSTDYASRDYASRVSVEAGRHFQEMEMKDLEFVPSLEEAMKIKEIKILAKEFFGAPLANCSAEGDDLSILERWFRELGVGWVLHIADGAPAGELEHALDASSWIPALTEIMHTFCITLLWLLPDHGSVEEEQLQLASFTQQAMSKMLTFVDFITAPNLTREVVFIGNGMPEPAPYGKLHTLLRVREALSMSEILLPFDSSSSAELATIQGEIVNGLLAKEGKVRGAIWRALKEIRTRILESLEDGQGSSGTQTPPGPSDIDEAAKSVMMFVMFLENYDWIIEPIVSEAASKGKYVPRVGDVQPLTSLEVEMVSCLEKKLANKSKAFPDQGLKFLFLLNNSSFIADQLHDTPYFPKSYKVDLARKVEGYMKRYMQVSWAPVLSCLINPTPSCLGKNYSPLHKFESEFQKMYTTQKLWKVPDPKLRNRLRRIIIDKVIQAYTRYLADNYGNGPVKFSLSNLREMLQELFEG